MFCRCFAAGGPGSLVNINGINEFMNSQKHQDILATKQVLAAKLSLGWECIC